jgi:hypothetical protein
VFETTDFELDVSDGEMKSIHLYGDTMDVVVLGNFGISNGEMQAAFSHTGSWFEYFTGDTLDVTASEMNISLDRGEYRLYTDKALERPEISTSLNERSDKGKGIFNGKLYPNPVRGNVTLSFELNEPKGIGIMIYDIKGRAMVDPREQIYSAGKHEIVIDTSSFDQGLYFCVIDAGQFSEVLKFIRK